MLLRSTQCRSWSAPWVRRVVGEGVRRGLRVRGRGVSTVR